MIQAGTRLGDRYVLVDLVGRGGLGQVWRAHDTALGRVVAVKLMRALLSDDPGFMQRFRAYAQVIAGLDDPNIVGVYDVGQTDGVAYLVTQFVEGESLHALLSRDGPLAPPHAMNLIAQAARALHVAHSKWILHLDVKASNLLVRPDGRLLVSDFRLARIISAESMAEVDELVYTNSVYIAPEQFTGRPRSPSMDIYALGVVAYVCLMAQPFPGDEPNLVPPTYARQDPPPLPPHFPEAVRHVVQRALGRDHRARWPSAEAMGAAAAAAAIGHPG